MPKAIEDTKICPQCDGELEKQGEDYWCPWCQTYILPWEEEDVSAEDGR
jgi:tRNA(Ile2) C34 agmatinyltransferase TiaS